MRRLVGLCGYARAGKDTAAANMPGWQRMAFADALKEDLQPLLKSQLHIDPISADAEQKAIIRPLLVEWGRTARRVVPDFWIKRLWRRLPADGDVVISDVRYLNEARAVLEAGGIVVYVERSGIGPANIEEESSIRELRYALQPQIVENNGSPEDLGRAVLRVVAWAEQHGLLRPA